MVISMPNMPTMPLRRRSKKVRRTKAANPMNDGTFENPLGTLNPMFSADAEPLVDAPDEARVLPESLDRNSTTLLAEPPEGYFNGIVNGMRVHLRVGTLLPPPLNETSRHHYSITLLIGTRHAILKTAKFYD